MPQGLDGVEMGGSAGRINSEGQADGNREAKGQDDRPFGHEGGGVHDVVPKGSEQPAPDHPDATTD